MKAPRHGCRVVGLVAILAVSGCGAQSTPSRHPATPPPSISHREVWVPHPPSPVAEFSWGSDAASSQLAIRLEDGRFAISRPSSVAPVLVTSPSGEPPARAVAVVSPTLAVTGHVSGLILWDTSSETAQVLDRMASKSVSALASVPGEAGEPALLAGGEDGLLIRVLVSGTSKFGRTIGTIPGDGVGIRKLVLVPGSREVVALRADGSSRTHRNDLVGPISEAVPCLDLAYDPGGTAFIRRGKGPGVEIGPSPLRRQGTPGIPSCAISAGGGTYLIVGVAGACVMTPISEQGPISFLKAVKVSGYVGSPLVSVDPSDPSGRSLAVGDGEGRIERLSLDALIARGFELSLDEVPELAFRPALRFGRSRRPVPLEKASAILASRILGARTRLESGETAGPLATLRNLEVSETVDLAETAEIRALIAAAESQMGGISPGVLTKIEEARDAFQRLGQFDRAADMEFWKGLVLTRPIEPGETNPMRHSNEDVVRVLRRASALYERADPPLSRQARLADAATSFALLDQGDISAAIALFAPVAEAARADPVLDQVPELDRIAASIAMNRGDWKRAETAYSRIIDRVTPAERPALWREAAIGRARAFLAMGQAREAADCLEPENSDDASWVLLRLTCRLAAGMPTKLIDPSDEDPIAAHSRALIALANESPPTLELAADLARAAEAHRLAGRDELAMVADLEGAEVAERRGALQEAKARFVAVSRRTLSLLERRDDRRNEGMSLGLSRRAARGFARCEIVSGQAASALTALVIPTEDDEGTLGLSPEEFDLARDLFRIRQSLEAVDPATEVADRDRVLKLRRLETALAGRRLLPSTGPKAGRLGLEETEAMLVFAAISPSAMAGFVIRGDEEPKAKILPIRRDDLEHAIASWRAGLGDGGRPPTPGRAEPFAALLGPGEEPDPPIPSLETAAVATREARLYDALVGPFDTDLEGVTRLFLVPDGPLGGLPIDIFGRDHRLRDRLDVSYLPAPEFLPALRNSPRVEPASSDRLLFVSPQSEREVRFWAASARESDWKPEALVGDHARTSSLNELSPWVYSAIHFAAEVTRETPLDEPAFSLAGRRFAASDLLQLPLKARVLVLHFSETGTATGDDPRRFASAGLRAGAGAVVLTLWSPPVLSARRFYGEFYRRLREGETPAGAVAAARAAVARDPRFRDPVHWAGYVVYGP